MARLEYASKSDYQFQQAMNLLKGLQIMQTKAQ
jgi:carboxyl-terminal processing protease